VVEVDDGVVVNDDVKEGLEEVVVVVSVFVVAGGVSKK
jgi:hypothetical protein